MLLAAGDVPTAFVLHSTRDEQSAGALVRLDAATVQVAGGPAVPLADVIALQRQGTAPPAYPHDRPHAVFANGDRLPGRAISIAADKLLFRADLGKEHDLTIPLSALAAVWITPRAAARAAEPDGRRQLAQKRRQDVIWLGNNDTVAGRIVSLVEGGPLTLDPDGPPVTLPRDRLQGLLLNTELARSLRPRGPFYQLVLQNGARLSLKTVQLDGADVVGPTLFGQDVRVPLSDVVSLNTYQGKAVYLSDLPPRRYDHTPFHQGIHWPLATDRSVKGLDLRLAGGTFDKGIGLHSASRVSFALPNGSRWFESLVGLDESTGQSGSAEVQVLADDRPLLESAVRLRASDPPKALRLPLPARARMLTLVVEFGGGGDVQDDVDWANARVIVGG